LLVIKIIIMDNNNQATNFGQKGVFPGNSSISNPATTNNVVGVTNENITPASEPTSKAHLEPAKSSSPETNTYIKLETKNPQGQVSGVIEIDLISFRERGQESRYLSINVVGASQDGGQSDTTISIDNEVDFIRFKEFVSKLNWND